MQRDPKKRCGQHRLQLSTIQKPQFTKSPGVIHALGKAEIPGEEVEPRSSMSPSGRKVSHWPVQAGGFQEDGGRLWVATAEM